MTPKKRKHKNNKARLTAEERRDAYFVWLHAGGDMGSEVADRAYVLKMLRDHAAATLDRKKRRAR